MEDSIDNVTDNSRDPANDLCPGRLPKYLNCCARLHHALHLITHNVSNKEGILLYLTSTLSLMEEVANDPKFIEDDDGNVDEETDVVPPEIKEWLASTFTTTVKYVRKSERPRFRAVAKAILAMIMVEKIFKKSNENAALKIPQAVSKMMDNGINEWDFDLFKLNEISNGEVLKNLSMYLFLHHNILRKYKISVDCLDAFLDVLCEGYDRNKNPYNNSLHAADVLQTVHFFIHNFKLNVWMTDLQTFTFLFSAIIHDYDNPGVSNSFLIRYNHPLAMIYNDIHVRENHHLASVFKLLQNPDLNFLRAMFKGDYIEFRRMTIECVLNMDVCNHFQQLKQMRTELAIAQELDKVKVMSYLLHVSDFAHTGKRTKFHVKWINKFQEQQYIEGDMERKLNVPYSPFCNREYPINIEAICSFLVYIIDPMFHLLLEVMTEIEVQNTFVRRDAKNDVPKKTSFRDLFPWENHLVINKSLWQRRLLLKKTSSNAQNS